MSNQQVIKAPLVATIGALFCFGFVTAQAQPGGGGFAPDTTETPRLASGKPDLTGSWATASGGPRGVPGGMFRRCTPFQTESCMEWTNQSADFAFMAPARLD